MKVSELYTYAPKSKIKAGQAKADGKYQFYASSPDENRRCDEYLYEASAIIMGTGGSATLHYFDGKFATSTDCLTLLPNESVIPKYLYYFFLGNFDILEAGFKGAGLRHTNKGYIDNIEIRNLPDLEQQRKVVDLFDSISKRINNKHDQINKLDSLIKARFVEMFGVPGANPKGWNEIKLGEVCDLQNGYAFKSSDYVDRSSVLNCRMSNIRPDGGFDAEYHPKYLPEEYWDKCSNYRLFDGDVIIAMTDMASDPKILGVPTIVSTNGKKFLLNQRVGKLSFLHDDRINRVYLMHSLGQKYIRKELAKSAAGSTQINVGKPAILNIDIYEPPRLLQNQFADFVAQVDKSKFALSDELAVCDFYIRLIHDRVMHGRIDLRVS